MAQVKRARQVPVFRLELRDLTVEARVRFSEQIAAHRGRIFLDACPLREIARRVGHHLRAAVAVGPSDVNVSARRPTRRRRNATKL